MGQLVESGSSTKVAGVHGVTAAEGTGSDLAVEDTAEVDVRGRNKGVSDDATTANVIRIRAAQSPRARVLVRDSGELGDNA